MSSAEFNLYYCGAWVGIAIQIAAAVLLVLFALYIDQWCRWWNGEER